MMNEVSDEDITYEDTQNDDVDMCVGDIGVEVEEDEEEEKIDWSSSIYDKKIIQGDVELIEFKEKNISYYKRFYANKSIYCVNSYKKWIYFGSINNNCYLYNNFDNDLKNFVNEGMSSNTSSINGSSSSSTEMSGNGLRRRDKEKMSLQHLKHQKYTDTVTNIKFSKSYKYIALCIYNGDIYIYDNNNMNRSEILSYNITNFKQNINNSNSLLHIYNWNVGITQFKKEEEWITEDMNFINILSINDANDKKDIEYFMFCPFNEEIILSIYLDSPNIYIWNIRQNTPISITYTTHIPTFINICNYENNFYLIAGFNSGETYVYDYDIYNLKKRNVNKKNESRIKSDHNDMMMILNHSKKHNNYHHYDHMGGGGGEEEEEKGEMETLNSGSPDGLSMYRYSASLNNYSIVKTTPEVYNSIGAGSGIVGGTTRLASHGSGVSRVNNELCPVKNHHHPNGHHRDYHPLSNQDDDNYAKIMNDELDNSNDVLCIDNNLSNEIYVSTYRNIIQIRNIKSNNVVSTFQNLHNDLVDYCLFNNKRNNIFASSSLDNSVIVYDYDCKKYINKFVVNYDFNKVDTNNQMETGINFLKWINTNLLLFSSLNGNIYIYDIRSRQCIHQFYSHTDTIFNVHLSLHLYDQKNILCILTASDDRSSNMHFLDISSFI
ncbi:WD domain, G-beta repeat domain containing protein [Plasmodium gonderi]|uniref:WD domain, G-beta repeat domain containing protein n=1 Tax=Plasmodium gonderi TaxID=77519 RepID=A0A1Y1JGV2_PLAGO|nr:WD domain, G-beta repeat domain containing protein [Plasmodium gonderi]GAW79992.1 WD domain, G-beta repeat domain containing protein [Plasmodium gonderi]